MGLETTTIKNIWSEFYSANYDLDSLKDGNNVFQLSDSDTTVAWGVGEETTSINFYDELLDVSLDADAKHIQEYWGDIIRFCNYFKELHQKRLVTNICKYRCLDPYCIQYLPLEYLTEVLLLAKDTLHKLAQDEDDIL